MNEKELSTVPYIVYEIAKARYRRTIKRLAAALVLTNVFYLILFISRR